MSESGSEKEAVLSKNVFVSGECAVQRVTVYSDRAEVCRQVETAVTAGVNEVILKQLPASIDSDSIRVEGTGSATIVEVTFQRKYETKDEADTSGQEKELESQLAELRKEKDQIEAQKDVMTKQWKLLDNFGESVSSSVKSATDDKVKAPPPLNADYFSGIKGFLRLFREEGIKLETSRLELDEHLNKLDEKMATVKNNLSKLQEGREDTTESRECTIVLESDGDSKVTLLVSYVVSQASWIPSYDIRMFMTEGILKVMYYGQIIQNTGEDWSDAKLFLSTASPSVGGSVPELAISTLSLKPKRRVVKHAKDKPPKEGTYMSVKSQLTTRLNFRRGDTIEEQEQYASDMAHAVTTVKETTTSASYEIARQSTIPTDNLPHKVSVGIFDLEPKLEYITVPKVAPRAFLRAKVTNSSAYTLLAGGTSIFLDNTFVAKAELKSVSPGEEFECSLGVDPAVKVDYKPLHKFKESSGLFSKTACTTHEQPIEIKNTHDYPIKIEVMEQFPRSCEDKIKVALVEPALDLKHPEKNKDIYFNKQKHIVWDLEIDKQAQREITLKYTVEHPAGEEVETFFET